MLQYLDFFINGLTLTIELSLYSFIGSLIFGILGIILKTSSYKILQSIGNIYTTLVRSIPELIWVFLIYFSLNDFINYCIKILNQNFEMSIDNFEISSFLAGIFALSFCFGAYTTEALRGSLSSINKGQIEAAKVLGLNKKTIFLKIIMPQIFYLALPSLSNLFMILLKDTALLSVIGLNEIMRQTKLIISITKEPFTYYLIAAWLYLVLTFISFIILKLIKKYLFKWAYIK